MYGWMDGWMSGRMDRDGWKWVAGGRVERTQRKYTKHEKLQMYIMRTLSVERFRHVSSFVSFHVRKPNL